MATSKKNPLAQAAETLVTATDVPPSDEVWTPCVESLPTGKLGLDADVANIAAVAMRSEDASRVTWSVFSDVLFSKGVRAGMLRGKDKVEETVRELRAFIAHVRFGNIVAAEAPNGARIMASADVMAFEGDKKLPAWTLMTSVRKDIAKVRSARLDTYFQRLCDSLAEHETGKKKGAKVTLTTEEKYLDLLGPVLLFLQGIDLTKVDPKFDWNEEFSAISAAVTRAKKAKSLATRK